MLFKFNYNWRHCSATSLLCLYQKSVCKEYRTRLQNRPWNWTSAISLYSYFLGFESQWILISRRNSDWKPITLWNRETNVRLKLWFSIVNFLLFKTSNQGRTRAFFRGGGTICARECDFGVPPPWQQYAPPLKNPFFEKILIPFLTM